jgi:hypothetical protein
MRRDERDKKEDKDFQGTPKIQLNTINTITELLIR